MNLNEKNSINFKKARIFHLIPPVVVILGVVFFLLKNDTLNAEGYVQIQKEVFLFLNKILSIGADFQHNVTQIGDALISFSFFTILFLKMPKFWEVFLMSSLLTLLFSGVLKEFIDVPRPAQVFDNQAFTIIGKRAVGFSSCPSGHSISIFNAMILLMYAFMPEKKSWQFYWCFAVIFEGFLIAISRVAVGAHHPFDVLLGSCIGAISAILGILICNKFRIFAWVENPKFYPFFIVAFLVFIVLIINDLRSYNLLIYYIAIGVVLISLFKLIKKYVAFLKK